MMIMFGMVITVGLLVDNAIIVVEYADRKMTEGFSQARGVRRRRAAHVLAGRLVDRDDACRLRADAVLARRDGQVHELICR